MFLRNGNNKEIFMAALLKCSQRYREDEVKIGDPDDNIEFISRSHLEAVCPEWVKSELIYDLIKYNICSPVLDNKSLTIDNKVNIIKSALVKYAVENGLQLPA